MTRRPLIAAALLAMATPAFAQVLAPSGSAPAAGAPTERTAPPRAADVVDRLCLRETGTLIRSRRAPASGERCPSHVYGRVWTQDDLRATGATDIAQGLRMLDPSIR